MSRPPVRPRYLTAAALVLAAALVACAPKVARLESPGPLASEDEAVTTFARSVRPVRRVSAENDARSAAERARLVEADPAQAALLDHVASHPDDLEAKQRLASAYLENELYWSAYELLEDLERRDPGRRGVSLGLASIWRTWGESDLALEAATREVSRWPSPESYHLQGLILLDRGEGGAAVEAFLKADELEGGHPEPSPPDALFSPESAVSGSGQIIPERLESTPMLNEIEIVIADDHSIFRHGLSQLLTGQEAMRVVGEAEDGREAITLVRDVEPDVLLLDTTLPDMTGGDILRQLSGIKKTHTILLADGLGLNEMTQGLILGACGAIDKTASPAVLFKCIRSVMAGELWFSRDVTKALLEHVDRSEDVKLSGRELSERLTRRENDVLRAVANGLPNRDIAAKLKISEYTVKHHLSRIFGKLSVANRVELALLASKYDL